jgi:fibro-slime domain-containing protein
MKLLPFARHTSALRLGVRRAHTATLVGLVGLGLVAGCGASGDNEGDGVVTAPDDQSGGGSGGSPSITPPGGIEVDCTGSTCTFGGIEVPIPPGCGDGNRTPDEACDDGNKASGDGCAETCLFTEPGFSCATPGQPCRAIARCGDGVVAPTEICDDGNIADGDGCSSRCRVELGKKCEGAPSVCTDAVCGNGIKEGAEACDDGNNDPFDGCSPICLKEPNCEGLSCVSDCGDGLIINEDCDDGNLIDGDGCSSTCQREAGFDCVAQAACEQINGQCVLRAPAIFRDFSVDHADFGEDKMCTALALNAVAAQLDAEGKPAIGQPANATAACLSTGDNFAQWYRSSNVNQTVVGEITLFDNGQGGYVNRFGAEGEQFSVPDPTTERNPQPSAAACENGCRNEATNALQCQNQCRPPAEDAQQLTNGPLIQLTNELNQANNAAVPDPAVIADLEGQIADVQAQIDALQAEATQCLADCNAEIDSRTATCAASCKPCSFDVTRFCSGGDLLSFDGNPLFFPVDSVDRNAPTFSPAPARIPDQYGTTGFPGESVLFPNLTAEQLSHNFYFTSEVQYWFKYDANTQAQLDFLGDDDVWVFLNGRLAVDLGGIHVPSYGTVTINAAAGTVNSRVQDGREGANGMPMSAAVNTNRTPADYGLEPGNVYTIKIFQAERKRDGSSFQLTLAGFEATPSDCTPICGDGVLSFGEECDDTVNDGGYNECNPGCVLGPFCGDGQVQADFGEQCDVGPIGDATCRGCRLFQVR